MSIDSTFFEIVGRLGPFGDIDLKSYESHPAIAAGSAPTPAERDPETSTRWGWNETPGSGLE